jgi:hypothetical protein
MVGHTFWIDWKNTVGPINSVKLRQNYDNSLEPKIYFDSILLFI